MFKPDLVAFDAIVVDTKVIEQITEHERGMMLNYLRITRLRVGVILNFKHRKLEWEAPRLMIHYSASPPSSDSCLFVSIRG